MKQRKKIELELGCCEGRVRNAVLGLKRVKTFFFFGLSKAAMYSKPLAAEALRNWVSGPVLPELCWELCCYDKWVGFNHIAGKPSSVPSLGRRLVRSSQAVNVRSYFCNVCLMTMSVFSQRQISMDVFHLMDNEVVIVIV